MLKRVPLNSTTIEQSLWSRNYKALLFSITTTKFGSVGFIVAATMVVKELVDSGVIIALILSMSALAGILFASFAGIVVDNSARKQLFMRWSDASAFLVSCALILIFAFTASLYVKVISLMIVVFLFSCFECFFNVSSRSLLPAIVGPANITRANANIVTCVSVASISSQGLAALILAVVGPIVFFIIDALTYLLSALSSFFICLKPTKKAETLPIKYKMVFSSIKQSWLASKDVPGISALFILVSVVNFISAPTAMYIVFLVVDRLGLSLHWYAWFMAFLTLGGVTGAFISKQLARYSRYHILFFALVSLSLLKTALAFSSSLSLSVVILFLEANLYTIISIMLISHLQTRAPHQILGKVLGMTELFGRVFMPAGLLIGGVLVDATQKNMPMVFFLNGVLLGVVCVIYGYLPVFKLFFRDADTTENLAVEYD